MSNKLRVTEKYNELLPGFELSFVISHKSKSQSAVVNHFREVTV